MGIGLWPESKFGIIMSKVSKSENVPKSMQSIFNNMLDKN